ncbi:unnamed protein product [Sphenostylis stenocarpa]|uniref:Sieve element occlusion N-terminal domain-containing protein n=1 Tax=Sphenostylis stenocarpa TaxID=92480 RepID=A0AA86RYM3_9FABA|nr:unnamed protein product [Sphenostylis stenocarpa]
MSDDDSILLKALGDKHKPDQGIEYDVKPIFGIVEDTLTRSAFRFEDATKSSLAPAEDRSHHPGYTSMPEALSAKIQQISSE